MVKTLKFCVAVGGESCNGPDLVFVIVEATPNQHENGEHYLAAQEFAKEQGLDGPFWCVDHQDPAKAVLKLFEWKTASVIKCS
jgi:hypothetical protein